MAAFTQLAFNGDVLMGDKNLYTMNPNFFIKSKMNVLVKGEELVARYTNENGVLRENVIRMVGVDDIVVSNGDMIRGDIYISDEAKAFIKQQGNGLSDNMKQHGYIALDHVFGL